MIKKLHFGMLYGLLLVATMSSPTTLFAEQSPQKHVIGAWPNGFFSAFLGVLNHLDWCEKTGKTPVVYWDNQSLYYDNNGFNGSFNVWEYYFEPTSNLKYQPGDYINYSYSIGHWTFFYFSIEQQKRDQAHQLISKYIKINRHTQQKIDTFYQQNMAGKKTIGIHLRGTDKGVEEKLVAPEKIVKAALRHADETTQFLIATDEHRLLNGMIDLLRGRKVIYYDSYRSNNGQPIHRKPSPGQLGEDVLVEVSLLARCNMLVHTVSNVSTAALYFNPDMPDVLVS